MSRLNVSVCHLIVATGASIVLLSSSIPTYAQTGLPPGPTPTPALPAGPLGGTTETYQVTSAANEFGSYLWIVASGQHLVILCEKSQELKDFSCTTKRLP